MGCAKSLVWSRGHVTWSQPWSHSGSRGVRCSPCWGTVSECSLLFQHKVTFDPTSSYTLEDLKPDTLYHFQLAARSEMGVGVFTPTIEARTAQSSKCLLRLLPATAGLGHRHTHPSPLTRGVVRSAGPWTGLWSGLRVWTLREEQVSSRQSASRQLLPALLPTRLLPLPPPGPAPPAR